MYDTMIPSIINTIHKELVVIVFVDCGLRASNMIHRAQLTNSQMLLFTPVCCKLIKSMLYELKTVSKY